MNTNSGDWSGEHELIDGLQMFGDMEVETKVRIEWLEGANGTIYLSFFANGSTVRDYKLRTPNLGDITALQAAGAAEAAEEVGGDGGIVQQGAALDGLVEVINGMIEDGPRVSAATNIAFLMPLVNLLKNFMNRWVGGATGAQQG